MVKSLIEIPASDPVAVNVLRQVIDKIIAENRDLPGGLMVVLNELQSQIGFVSLPMQQYVARQMNIPMSTVHGVVSFYSFFVTTPRGRHTIKFCMGTACYVGGVPQLIEKAKQVLNLEPGETSADGEFTLELCRCVGICSQAPVIVIDEEVHGRVRPNKLPQIIRSVQAKKAEPVA
jgi:NADH:ubiquinone oxidoreductase subunit E